MFTQSAFIRKNTPELREKLKYIGYMESPIFDPDAKFLYTISGQYDSTDSLFNINDLIQGWCSIECLNENLFLALAALRDDSDYMQWFIWDSPKDTGKKWKKYDDNPNWNWWKYEAHKATVLEIIEHFKTER